MQAQAAHSLSVDGFHIGVSSAEGTKCERCWSYCHTVAEGKTEGGAYPGACSRCAASLGGVGFVLPELEEPAPAADPAAAAAPAAASAAAAAPAKKLSSKEKKSSSTRPPISLQEQQKAFEARRMTAGNKLVTPPKPAEPEAKPKAKPDAKADA